MIFLGVVALFLATSLASEINFSATPATFTPGSASDLTLRCSVNDAVIVRAISARDVAHVTAIVVTRTNPSTGVNETVARISTFDPATALVDAGQLTATGTTASSTPGENGYLELVWTNPTQAQIAPYYCEAFTLNTDQHPENFEAALDVSLAGSLTNAELMLYITNLQNRIDGLEKQVNQSSGGSASQMGNVQCTQGTNDYQVAFSSPFSSVPQVYTAVAGYSSSDAFVFTPTIVNVDQNGFTLRCVSNRNTDLLWIAQ